MPPVRVAFFMRQMMKYRKLTKEELNELEQEFIQFLVSNTITAEDWLEIKDQEIEKAEKLIELFSDQVLDKALSNIKFLEHRSPKNVLLFFCRQEEIDMIGLSIDPSSEFDLTNEEDLAKMTDREELSIFKNTKKYTKNREEEIFEMLNNGCLTTDEKLYKAFAKL